MYNTNDENESEKEIINYKYQIEVKKLEKEISIKKIECITDLFKNKLITIDEYKNMLEVL